MPLTGLREGEMRPFELAGREIVVCRTREGVFALDNLCTHAFARLSEGWLRGTRLFCPLHGGSFDTSTGCALSSPAMHRVTTHVTRIVDGMVEVALSCEEARSP